MKKQVKVGGMSLDIPEHDTRIGSAVQALQDAYEKGDVKGVLIIVAADDGLTSVIAAPPIMLPGIALAGNALTERVLDGLCYEYSGQAAADRDADDE
jgi:hypothetical protein